MRVLDINEIQSLLLTHSPGAAPAMAGRIEVVLGRSPTEDELQRWLETDMIVADGDTRLRDAIFTAMSSPAPPPVPVPAVHRPVVHSGTAGNTRQSTATPAPAQVAPAAKSSFQLFQIVGLVVLLAILAAVFFAIYLLKDISGIPEQIANLQKGVDEVAVLRAEVREVKGYFSPTMEQGRNADGHPQLLCQMDGNGNMVLKENGECETTDKPLMVRVPSLVSTIIATELDARLGKGMVAAIPSWNQPRSFDGVPSDPGLYRCLDLVGQNRLAPDIVMRCCEGLADNLQTICRQGVECKLDPSACQK